MLTLVVLLLASVFAEEGHVHTEECDCEKSLEKDITIPDTQEVKPHEHDSFEVKIAELLEYMDLLYEKLSELEFGVKEFQDAVTSGLDGLSFLEVNVEILNQDVLKIFDTLGKFEEKFELENEHLGLLNELVEMLNAKLNIHDIDIVNIFDVLSTKVSIDEFEPVRDTVDVLTEQVSVLTESVLALHDKFETLESDCRLEMLFIKNSIEQLASKDELKDELKALENDLMTKFEKMLDSKIKDSALERSIGELRSDLNKLGQEFMRFSESTTKKLFEQDRDIVLILDSLQKMWEELQRLSAKVSTLEVKFGEVYRSVGGK